MAAVIKAVGLSALYIAAFMWGFWYLYVLVMGLYRAYLLKQLTAVATALALPALIIGLAVDVIANWTAATWWFREWPRVDLSWPPKKPELVTDRLIRYISEPGPGEPAIPEWKREEAHYICSQLLDYFDPNGVHCKPLLAVVVTPE